MSAFLGPIHYWLYNKIQLQQAIVDEINTLGNQNGLSLKEEGEAKFGKFENKPLEEMIDHGNIHGWLQERVSQVEYKYAYSVTALLNNDPSLLSQLQELHKRKGHKLGQTLEKSSLDAPRLFQVITDNLLDGMPCDHANSIIDQSEDEITWKRNLCVHASYWAEVGGDITLYYELREAWIAGLVEECGFTFSKNDNAVFTIRT